MGASTLFATVLIGIVAFTTAADAAAIDASAMIPQSDHCDPNYPSCFRRCNRLCATLSPEDCQKCVDACGCNNEPRKA
ncbi:hypothetical protein BCR44DRAFT_41159 [Catenaria anguillulae PL171]|uniref:Uncharacterized protein n=1 Tax=Catenaria anguillulae PL171 TaxID=765915 RepID=A0A1Y2HMC9_9FUNG|nr:hypothetical protein BCR44DRAFT_41159 [Catenaria anguillulae PL171]